MLTQQFRQTLGESAQFADSTRIERLLHTFTAALHDEVSEDFLATVVQGVRDTIARGGQATSWHTVIDVLCQRGRETSDRRIAAQTDILHRQADRLISTLCEQQLIRDQLLLTRQGRDLRSFEARSTTAVDVDGVIEILVESLRQLHIPGCYLALYDDAEHPTEGSRLVLAYTNHQRIALQPQESRLPAHQCIPVALLPQTMPYRLVIEALYSQDQHIGFVIFENGPRAGSLYEALRMEISSALERVSLLLRIQSHATELAGYQEHLEDLVRDRTAELTRSNTILHDEIEERRRAEQALHISEQQYRLLAENVMEGVVIVQAGQIRFVNHAFTVLLARPADQLLTSGIMSCFPSDIRQEAQAWLDDRGTAEEATWEVPLMARDKRPVWAEIAQKTITWNHAAALLLTIRDVTARKFREQRLEEERVHLQKENLAFQSAIAERYRFGKLVGKNQAMQRVYTRIADAAAADVNVVIIGESGTGKELIAQMIHQLSARSKQPLVSVNCASIQPTLFESAFFGHRKGAFTSADRDRNGFFDRAHQGILFLDEVTELSADMQAKLLRVLQDGSYTPVGSTLTKYVDAVIIAATNKDVREEIARKRLREDFFYRICKVEIRVPPLRDRKDDLPLLIEHLLYVFRQKHGPVSSRYNRPYPANVAELPGELVQTLYAYEWPGNVRELDSILQRYLISFDLEDVLTLLGSQVFPRQASFTGSSPAGTLPEAVENLEKKMIADALAQTGNHIGKAVKLLGMPRSTLKRKITQYGLRKT